MPRTAYDSTNAADLPRGGDLYLAYTDGAFANVAAVRRRFPRKPVVGITVTGADLDAHIVDTEPGNVGVDGAARWCARKLAHGQHPTVYTYAANVAKVKAALKSEGVAPSKVSFFVASYDGKREIPAGCVGKQYLSPDGPPHARPNGHYDVSVVADYWPGVDKRTRKGLSKPASAAVRVLHAYLARRVKTNRHPLKAHARERLDALKRLINETEKIR